MSRSRNPLPESFAKCMMHQERVDRGNRSGTSFVPKRSYVHKLIEIVTIIRNCDGLGGLGLIMTELLKSRIEI
jgi:hypothetical protein